MRVVTLSAALLLALSPIVATAQDEPQAQIRVEVAGEWIDGEAIGELFRALYNQNPKIQMKIVEKKPEEMPQDATFFSFQGREAGPPPSEVIWQSTTDLRKFTSWPAEQRKAFGEQYMAALALAKMDAGDAGPTLSGIYAKTPTDRASRQALGIAVARAINAASDQATAFAASEVDWIRSNITSGMTRAQAYAALKSKSLVPYNYAFEKGHQNSEGGCDSDPSSAAWPYKGEPVPKRSGACATMGLLEAGPIPDARIELVGAFNLACAWKTEIIFRFDDGDRVSEVNVAKPRSVCM